MSHIKKKDAYWNSLGKMHVICEWMEQHYLEWNYVIKPHKSNGIKLYLYSRNSMSPAFWRWETICMVTFTCIKQDWQCWGRWFSKVSFDLLMWAELKATRISLWILTELPHKVVREENNWQKTSLESLTKEIESNAY